MPGGLLDGRGCYDSIKRSERESHLFLSIRNHGTPFIVEQHKSLVDPEVFHARAEASIDETVRARFAAGGMPILRKFIRLFFLIIVYPFNFCFNQLPILAKEKVFLPVSLGLRKVILKIKKPFILAFERICSPIITLFKKVGEGIRLALSPVINAYLSAKKISRRIKLQWQSKLVAPPKRFFRKIHHYALNFSHKCVRWVKLTKAWAKVLWDYGLKVARGKDLDGA